MTKNLENRVLLNFDSFKRSLKKKILPLALSIPLLFANTSCDLYNQYLNYISINNIQEEEQIIEKKKKAVILINTSELEKPEYDLGYSSLRTLYNILRLNKIGYDSTDIYVLGHDESYSYSSPLYPDNSFTFDDYRQLTRKNLEDVMNEINDKYSEDAFLMIHVIGDSIKEDLDKDGTFDSSSTKFVDEKYYSYEYPELISSFLRNERKVGLNIDQNYSGFIYDSFNENQKDNILVLVSSGKNEEINNFSFSNYFSNLLYNAEEIDSTKFNSDGNISGQEAFDYLSENMTNSTPQLWTKDTTQSEDFYLSKY